MKKSILGALFLLLLITLSSCNKDQRAVKRLNGQWESVKIGGFSIPNTHESYHTLSFNECKLKDNDYCEVTIKDTENSVKTLYRVENDGTRLVYKTDEEDAVSEIVTLEKNKLILKSNYEGVGLVEIEYSKI